MPDVLAVDGIGIVVKTGEGVVISSTPEECECCVVGECWYRAYPCPGQTIPPGTPEYLCLLCAGIDEPIVFETLEYPDVCWQVELVEFPECLNPQPASFGALDGCEDCIRPPPCFKLLQPCVCPPEYGDPPPDQWCVACTYGQDPVAEPHFWNTSPPLNPWCWYFDPGSEEFPDCPGTPVYPPKSPNFNPVASCPACCPPINPPMCNECDTCSDSFCLIIHVQTTPVCCNAVPTNGYTVMIPMQRVGPATPTNCSWGGSVLCPQEPYQCHAASCCPLQANGGVVCTYDTDTEIVTWELAWTIHATCCFEVQQGQFECLAPDLIMQGTGFKIGGQCPDGGYTHIEDPTGTSCVLGQPLISVIIGLCAAGCTTPESHTTCQ